MKILRELRKAKNISQQKLANIIGVSRSTIAMWETGASQPDNDMLLTLSKFFNVSIDYLLGNEQKKELPSEAIPVDVNNFIKIPILGTIRCGEPMFAEENIEGYETIDGSMLNPYDQYFFLKAIGDSMINAGIHEGDLLLIRVQTYAETGDIVVVNINGDEATLKKVIFKENAIILQPENPKYDTKIFIGEETKKIHIQGKLVMAIKKF